MFLRPILILVLAGATLGAAPRLVSGSKPIPAKHAKSGLDCYDCHQKETPDHAAVPDDSCINCHGDYPAMAAYTAKVANNPHAFPAKGGHPQPTCVACHRQHKPPVVTCLECHPTFKLTPR